MLLIADLKRLLKPAAGLSGLQTRIKFMQEAILCSHNLSSPGIGKEFKGRLHNLGPVALIKPPGMFVKGIGVVVQPLFRIGSIIGNEGRCLAWIPFTPDPDEIFKNSPLDAIQKADREKSNSWRQS
jgi:hypothetical protein